jgi:transposase
LFDWPPYSLDLNPIEQVWVHLKRKVVELHLELEFVTRKSEVDLEALEKALIEAWNALLTSLFEL